MEETERLHTCPSCGAPIVASSKYCSQCGGRLGQTKARWYYNVWFVLVMLFFVLGPFALPLVWKNPHLSNVIKIVLTLAVSIYIMWFISLALQAVQLVMGHYQQLNSSFLWY